MTTAADMIAAADQAAAKWQVKAQIARQAEITDPTQWPARHAAEARARAAAGLAADLRAGAPTKDQSAS